jgi:hypothetical protein
MSWKHASLVVCLRQLSLSLFLWSTARRGPWDTWQHRSSPLRKAEPGAVEHMAAPELTSARRRGPESWDTWQHQSSPQQGGKVQSRGTQGSTGAHLSKEVRYRAARHVAAPELTSSRRRGPGPWDMWWHWSPPLQGGVLRRYSLRGSAWMHALLFVLT